MRRGYYIVEIRKFLAHGVAYTNFNDAVCGDGSRGFVFAFQIDDKATNFSCMHGDEGVGSVFVDAVFVDSGADDADFAGNGWTEDEGAIDGIEIGASHRIGFGVGGTGEASHAGWGERVAVIAGGGI